MDQVDDEVYLGRGVFQREECARWIEDSVRRGFSAATVLTRKGYKLLPKIRTNERVNLDDAAWADELWKRVRPLTPMVDRRPAIGLDSRLRFYRYLPGQEFKPHKDGVVRSAEDASVMSQLTCLIYLNDDFEGGATVFYGADYDGTPTCIIEPQCGALLLFRHDRWHAGAPVVSGEKYVLRTDVFFSPTSSTS